MCLSGGARFRARQKEEDMSQVSSADARQGAGPLDELVVEFAGWLDGQRGLAPVTVQNYCWHVEQFLGWLSPHVLRSVGLLDAGMVTAFMVEFCRDRNVNSAKSMARSVRSFLSSRMRRDEHRPACGVLFPRRLAGIWRRCRDRCLRRTWSTCW